MTIRFLLIPMLVAGLSQGHAAESEAFRKVAIVVSDPASTATQQVADLLASRLSEGIALATQVTLDTQDEAAEAGTVKIYLGIPSLEKLLQEKCEGNHIAPLSALDPGAEGFALKRVGTSENPAVFAVGADERGVLYAAGEILRRVEKTPEGVILPCELDVRTAPAFRIRGTEVSQGATITELTGSRKWTEEEWQRALLEYALAGANTFGAGHVSPVGKGSYSFLKSYGLKTMTDVGPNVGSGPPEWQAKEAIGRKGYLCLSVPEAREAILERWDAAFKNSPSYDYLRFHSGDGGGCECEKCAPYGRLYILMCQDIAALLHKYHPGTLVMATQQKLDNEGDKAIFDYLNEQPRDWLYALAYGPGSNAMTWQPGRRQTHRMDLFEYPAFGPTDRYLREVIHQLPPQQTLTCFTDVTHWVYSQFGLVNWKPYPDWRGDLPPHWGYEVYEKGPDPSLALVYDRRTFHARPRHYYQVFQNIMRYTEGDMTYSEGHHDHFNQWMWQRLLWNPHRSVEDLVNEYARLFFGPEAAPLMAEAIFQLEINLSAPLDTNPGIDRLYLLVREAGWKMPAWRMERSYLWRQYMQKAALDKYIQLRLREQKARVLGVEKQVRPQIVTAAQEIPKELPASLLAEIQRDIETPEMKRLRAEAGRLGEESDTLYGVRSEGFFNLDLDLVGLGWMDRELRKAREAASPKERAAILASLVNYEDPGEGGFYDDAGDPSRSPHLVHGWPYGAEDFSPENRYTQNTCAYSLQEDEGVAFEYRDLDPAAHYRVRFTFVRPRFEERYAVRQTQKTQSVFADGTCLAQDVELPELVAGQFEYPVPPEATHDGRLKISLKKSPGVGEGMNSDIQIWRNTGGWGTLVSEVWLMKEPG